MRNLAVVDQVFLDVFLPITAELLQLLQVGSCRRLDFFLVDDFGEQRTEIGRVEIVGSRWRPVTKNRKNKLDADSGYRLVGIDYGADLFTVRDMRVRL